MKVVIIDYGMGNLKSIQSAFKYLNVDVEISNEYNVIKQAEKLLLPGVGSFRKAINNIKKLEIDKILTELVLEKQKPVLGICLGMQLMTSSSNEDGTNNGLNFINAKCEKFDIDLRIPHIGFNQVEFNKESILYKDLNYNDFYFVHSYRVQTNDSINQSYCEYGKKFVASYEKNNILGVQFHPELSQMNGIKLIDNFLKGS